MAGMPASYVCIKAFSETDMTEDLERFDVPTLILRGDDDQIVPIYDSAELFAKLVPGAMLEVVQGGRHGMCITRKDDINAALLNSSVVGAPPVKGGEWRGYRRMNGLAGTP